MRPSVRRLFRVVGRGIASFFLILFAIVVAIGTRLVLIAVSIFAIMLLALPLILAVVLILGTDNGELTHLGGFFAAMAVFASTGCVTWFVAEFVWYPHLQSAITEATSALFRRAETIRSEAWEERFARDMMKSKSDKAG